MRVVRAFRPLAFTAAALLSLSPAWATDAADEQPVRLVLVSSETDLKAGGQFVQVVEQQIKIQTQAGLQQAGQMAFNYTVSMQKFEVLQAQTR